MIELPDLFAAPQWQSTYIGLVVVTLVALAICYLRCQAATWVRLSCAIMKAAAVALLGLFLLEPMLSTEVAKPGANIFLVVADSSQSLQVRDASARTSRESQLREKLLTETGWLETLGSNFDLRKFTFARQLKSTQFDKYNADGIGSSVFGSLNALAERYQNQPVAGLFLITDGNATDLKSDNIRWDKLPPVYPIVVGKDRPQADVSITNYSVSQTNFEAAPVNITANLNVSGMTGKSFRTMLLDESGKVVSEQTIANRSGDEPMAVRFKVRPEKAGVNFYRLRVVDTANPNAIDDPEMSTEATMVNNERTIVVDRGGGPYRILYVSGRPNWEFKFLRRALQADDEIDLVGLIRIAKQEPKFTFRSRQNERTNPLFRGFGNDDDEDAEQYDQPVLVRIGTRDKEELRDGFPKSATELFQYDAIVLDDVESGFFNEDQKSLIKEFVTVRGGGFLMLGGQEAFNEGKYDRTPISELLPVYLDSTAKVQRNSRYRLKLTREGWLQPWVRLESTEIEEAARLDSMPSFATINPSGRIKPGASVLAKVESNDGSETNALVAHRIGKGRAAALMIGDFWRWHFRNEQESDDTLKAWRQMMRWLVAEVPKQVEVGFESLQDENLSVQINVQLRDGDWQPMDNAKVVATITRPDGTEAKMAAEPLDEAAGLFGVTYVPRESGAYRVKVQANGSDGALVGESETGWVSEPATAEFENLEPNMTVLNEIADRTGGEVVTLSNIDRLARRMPAQKAPVMETKLYDWWHSALLFAVALLLLVGEWGLRRWKGLP